MSRPRVHFCAPARGHGVRRAGAWLSAVRHLLRATVLSAAVMACAGSPTPSGHIAISPADPRTADAGIATAVVTGDNSVRDADPFLSLETPSAETRAWEEQQNSASAKILQAMPEYGDLLRRVRLYRDMAQAPIGVEVRGSLSISLEKIEGGAAMALLLRNRETAPRLLYRATTADRVHIDFFAVSHSGRFTAFGVSEAGQEETTVRVVENRTGAVLPEQSFDVRNEQLVWFPDDSGYLYMRGRGRSKLPVKEQIRDLSVVLHRIGDPVEKDVEVVGSRAAGKRIHADYSYCYPSISLDGRYAIISVERGLNPDLSVFIKRREDLLKPNVDWTQIYDEPAHVTALSAGSDRLVVVKAASGHEAEVEAVLFSDSAKREVLYTSDRPLEDVVTTGRATYVVEVDQGTKRPIALSDKGAHPVQLPDGTSIRGDTLRLDPSSGAVSFQARSWTEWPSWWTTGGGAAQPLDAVNPPGVRDAAAAFIVHSLEAPARDGERVPLTVVGARAPQGSAAGLVWVIAHGAYGISLGPMLSPVRKVFLDLGGTIVVAHVRGGGEKGRAWYDAGRGQKKMATINDTIDSLKFLRAQGFGREGGIMLWGSSAGGIPVGGVLARAPNLVDAVCIEAGVVNPARLEAASAIGALHKEEFGNSDTPEAARSLREIDAYLNIMDGVAYPPVLLTADKNDARVPYWGTSKLAARLRRASHEKGIVLLRLREGGHISGRTAEEESTSDAELLSFALNETRSATHAR